MNNEGYYYSSLKNYQRFVKKLSKKKCLTKSENCAIIKMRNFVAGRAGEACPRRISHGFFAPICGPHVVAGTSAGHPVADVPSFGWAGVLKKSLLKLCHMTHLTTSHYYTTSKRFCQEVLKKFF